MRSLPASAETSISSVDSGVWKFVSRSSMNLKRYPGPQIVLTHGCEELLPVEKLLSLSALFDSPEAFRDGSIDEDDELRSREGIDQLDE